MFSHRVNEHTEMRPIDRQQGLPLFRLLDANRAYLQRWHPWVANMRSVADVEKMIALWQQQHLLSRLLHCAIWHQGQFCGMINHLSVDWSNRSSILTYWLDEAHQGKGIMTACCRAMIIHAFQTWKLNRITIECATENTRSRAIPERLGFKLEGIARQVEWLHDHFADHAIYGLLATDYHNGRLQESLELDELKRDLDRVSASLSMTC